MFDYTTAPKHEPTEPFVDDGRWGEWRWFHRLPRRLRQVRQWGLLLYTPKERWRAEMLRRDPMWLIRPFYSWARHVRPEAIDKHLRVE